MSLRGKSDVELVEACLRGETRAFDALHKRYSSKLIVFVYTFVLDRDKALDLVQETFLRVSDNLALYDKTRRFQTWIYTIAKNLARNELRNRRRNPIIYFVNLLGEMDLDDPDMEDPSLQPDELIEAEEARKLVWSVINSLQPDFREAIIMRDIKGDTYEEISQKLRINLGTVKSRMFRARAAFRQKILERAHLYKGS